MAEEKLAAQWGTSRGPVREALARLVQDGLAVSLPNGRTIVAELSAEHVADLYQLRLVLEQTAVDLAVVRAAPDELADLVTMAAALPGRAGRDGAARAGDRERIELDLALHRRLVASAHSLPLLRLWEGLGDTIAALVAATSLDGFDTDAIHTQHQHIAVSLNNRDAAAAKAWLAVHLLEARDRLIAHLHRRRAGDGS